MLNFNLTPEQQQLQETARRFAREEIISVAARYDDEQMFPADVMRKAWDAGLMNLEVPAEYGGPGYGVVEACLMCEELSYGCAGITDAIVSTALAVLPVLIAGTPAQKTRYLGQLTAAHSFASSCRSCGGAWCSPRCPLRTFRRFVEHRVQRSDASLRFLTLSLQAGNQGLLTSDRRAQLVPGRHGALASTGS